MSSDSSPPLSSHALTPGTKVRDYTIVEVIGTGGFSIVYRALDNALQREVAIKEYFPAAFALRDQEGSVRPHSRDAGTFSKGIESFLNEGKLLAAFDHPALVRVYRCWEERATAYLAMKLYSGTTLRDALQRGHWHADEVSMRALLRPMCDALDLLHASNCYHRDVAPDNIMLVDGGAPVLLDFGAARRAIESTQVFTAILKPGYAPIEQYGDGELKQGPWTDIYALAGVVYFALAGVAPPTAVNRMIRDSMPRPRDAFVGRLPESWLDAIEHALAVKPEQRPQSISEFVAAFDWDRVIERPAETLVPSTFFEPPEAAWSTAADIALVVADAAVTRRNDERTVVSPATAPAVDDQRTVVMPRRGAAPPAVITETPSPLVPAATAKPRRRPMVWLAGTAAAVAAGTLVWHLTTRQTPPAPVPSAPSTVRPGAVPPANAVRPNDASEVKKTSIPLPVVEQPPTATAVVPAPPQTLPQTPVVNQSSPSNPTATRVREKQPRVAAVTGDGPTIPRKRAERVERPARCDALIERFGLGDVPSAADQRFMKESCK